MLVFLSIFPCGGTFFFFNFAFFSPYMRKLKVNAYSCSKKAKSKKKKPKLFFLPPIDLSNNYESGQPALVPIELNS